MGLTRRRKVLFSAVLLVFCYTGIEALAVVGYWAWSGSCFSFADVAKQRRAVIGIVGDDPEAALAGQFGIVAHPYVGYVTDPSQLIGAAVANSHGWVSVDGPVVRREPNTVVVGLFGGSVARIFYRLGIAEFSRCLRENPAFAEKRIRFVGFGLGGYKQPQQQLALSYALGLGGEFDLVINLDGFNEVALPVTENLREGVNPFFPRGWPLLVTDSSNPKLRMRSGAVFVARHQRREAALAIQGSLLRFSVLANFIWVSRDAKFMRASVEAQQALQDFQGDDGAALPFAARGPSVVYADADAACDDFVRVWGRCSEQMERICSANGIRYFHFLQPNQYDDGAKSLSATERRVAFVGDSPYRSPVLAGYPKLRAHGVELRAAGVEFHDLSRVFERVKEPLYVDSCCHFNARGNEIIARAMAGAVTAAFAGKKAPGGVLTGLSCDGAVPLLARPLASYKLAIIGQFEGGRSRDLTYADVSYVSSDPSVASVSEFGVVQAQRPGKVTVTATKDGHSVTVDIRVAFEPIVEYGVGVPAHPRSAPRLQVTQTEDGQLRFELSRIQPDMAATLLIGVQPEEFRLCDTMLLVPLAGAIHVPMPVSGTVGEFLYAPPATLVLQTSYWQAAVYDSRAECLLWMSNAVALTPDR